NEMKDFLGDDVFSMETFVSVVESAVDEALNNIETGESKSEVADTDDDISSNQNSIKTKTYKTGDIESATVEKDADGNIISKTYVKADGSTVVNKYENGVKTSQETTYADGSKTSTELKYDESGKKIGATTARYDDKGGLQTLTEADYDPETGRKTHAKTTLADGSIQGEADYEYKENADGTYEELRYQIGSDGERTLTTTTTYSKEGNAQSAKDHINNTTETYETDDTGKIVSSTVKSQDGTVLSEDQLDENGNVLKHIKYTADGQIASETSYTYYDNGAVKSEETKTYVVETKAASANTETTEILTGPQNPGDYDPTQEGFSGTGELPSAVKSALDQKLGAGFSDKLEHIAQKLNCNPEDLVGVMYSESGLNASAYNSNGGATGLIQFMPSTAAALGTTTEALSNMSPVQQLDYVDKFFDMVKGNKFGSGEKLNAGNLYGLVFLPAYAKNDVLCTSSSGYYSGNRGLDLDGDGAITNKDLTNRVQNKYKEFCRSMGVSV
ncbi:MAG: transglycosylase SLT domain-containing protein, partial [Candidatus Gastranaerophilaceae bacterium]